VIFASLPFQFRILAKKELWPMAFIGWYLARSGQIPIDTVNTHATLSSLGVYSTDLRIPLDAFAAGLGDHKIVTTLCPGGKERMRRLMEVIASGRVDLKPLVTHRFTLDQIEKAYDLFSHQRDGVLKVAITAA